MNNINFGTFTGDFDLSVGDFTLSDKYGKAITNNKSNNTYTVMYFWDTACGYCIQDFPVFQTKLNKYAASKNIRFIAVNIPLKRDTGYLAEKILNERGWKFQNVYMRDNNDVKKFTVSSFPTTVILRNGKQMIYKGDISGVDKIFN